jgi:hypothetical protein
MGRSTLIYICESLVTYTSVYLHSATPLTFSDFHRALMTLRKGLLLLSHSGYYYYYYYLFHDASLTEIDCIAFNDGLVAVDSAHK